MWVHLHSNTWKKAEVKLDKKHWCKVGFTLSYVTKNLRDSRGIALLYF